MDYDIFLENNEKLKLNIFQLILANQHRISLEQIIETTDLSKYKATKLVNDLISDVKKISLTRPTHVAIMFDTSKNITGSHITLSTLRILRLHYLKESTTFKIFQYGFLENNHIPRQRFLASNFISQAQYYNIREKVGLILKQDQFPNATQLFITNHEFLTRTSLLNLYYFFFNGIENPFPELKEITSRFINLITMTFFLSMTPTQTAKLRIFFELQVKRIQNRHPITDFNDYESVAAKDKITTLQKFYRSNITNSTHVDLKSEIKTLMVFIQSQGLLTETIIKSPAIVQQTIQSLNQKIIFIIKHYFETSNNHLSDALLTDISIEINKLNDQILLYDNSAPGVAKQQLDKLQYSYPSLHKLTKQLVFTVIETTNFEINSDAYDKLYCSYLLLLINSIPPDILEDSVYICVDFSAGTEYSEFISQILNLFHNIHVSEKLTPKTDIYLSDSFSSTLGQIKQVIWTTLPIAANWFELYDEVSKIRNYKLSVAPQVKNVPM